MMRRILIYVAFLVMPLPLIAGAAVRPAVAQDLSTAAVAHASGAAGSTLKAISVNWTASDHIQAYWGDGARTLRSEVVVARDGASPTPKITVGPTATFAGNLHATTSFIPGQAIKFGVEITNLGTTSVTVKITAKLSGPQTISNVTGTVTAPLGPVWYTFTSTVPNLAQFGTYTNEETVVVSGGTYVLQSIFTLGDPRLQGAVNFMKQNENSTVYSSPPNSVPFSERAVENAYGITGMYSSAATDHSAQKAAGRLHAETNPNDSTAPAGALVFFTGANAEYGNVGIAVGNGTQYWTVDAVNGHKGIHIDSLTEGDGYLGWSLAPLKWPGYSGYR
jgi:hypothetical protein